MASQTVLDSPEKEITIPFLLSIFTPLIFNDQKPYSG